MSKVETLLIVVPTGEYTVEEECSYFWLRQRYSQVYRDFENPDNSECFVPSNQGWKRRLMPREAQEGNKKTTMRAWLPQAEATLSGTPRQTLFVRVSYLPYPRGSTCMPSKDR